MTDRRGRRHSLPEAERSWAWITVVVLVAMTVVAYLPIRHADWVQDDHVAVEVNPIVQRGDLGEILTTHYWAGARGEDATLYRPVLVASFAVERRITGDASAGLAHAVNLGLHVATSLMLFVLSRRLGAGPLGSSSAAMLFAVHPVHVEAVAGVVGRGEVLAALGTLVALWAWTHSGTWGPNERRGSRAMRRSASWLAAVCVLVALGSKEVAVAVVPLLMMIERLYSPTPKRRRDWLDLLGRWIPIVISVLIWYGLRVRALGDWWVTQAPHPVDNPLVRLEGYERIGTALALFVRYVGLLVFPVHQSADYSGPVIPRETGVFAPLPIAALLVLAALVLVWLAPLARPGDFGKRMRAASFGSALALFPYLVVGNLFVLVGTIFAERLLYLPSAGFCLLAGLFLGGLGRDFPAFRSWLPDRRLRYAGVILVLLVSAFAVLTYARATVWRTDRTVFEAAAAVHPESPRAQFILGKLALDENDLERAFERFERAIEAEAAYIPAWQESGIALARLGRYDEALARFRHVLVMKPDHAPARYAEALALQRLGRLDEAWRAVRHSLALDPTNAGAWATLGHVEIQRGHPDRAVTPYRRAIALGRSDLEPRLQALENPGGTHADRP